jgi:hypothetical protein
MAGSEVGGFPRMIRGSVVVQRRRCGEGNCRCTDGESLHEATVLSYSEGGRNRTVMLRADQVGPVRAAVEAYRAAQAKLETQGGYEALVTKFQKGAPRWSPMSWADESLNFIEYVIHIEDVRRGGIRRCRRGCCRRLRSARSGSGCG